MCKKCKDVCIEGAIEPPNIDKSKCIGCSHCKKACEYNAIQIYDDTDEDFFELLEKNVNLDTVEIHISIFDCNVNFYRV